MIQNTKSPLENLWSNSEKKCVLKILHIFAGNLASKTYDVLFRKAVESVDELNRLQFLIISDCRRPSDLDYFRENYNCRLIRVECSEEVRIQRGFVFTPNIDDQDTECALDSFNEWDKRIHNDGDLFILDSQLNEIIDLYSI